MKRRIKTCLWCETEVVVRWSWSIPVCADEIGCVRRVRENNYGPPDMEHYFEAPPDDIHVCHACAGNGRIQTRQDWETGAWEDVECVWCEGTGVAWEFRTSFFAGREA